MAKKCKPNAIWSEKRNKCVSLISLAKETKTWKRFGIDKLEKKIKKAIK